MCFLDLPVVVTCTISLQNKGKCHPGIDIFQGVMTICVCIKTAEIVLYYAQNSNETKMKGNRSSQPWNNLSKRESFGCA